MMIITRLTSHHYAFATILMWASANVVVRSLADQISPELLCSMRFFFASIFMLIIVVLKKIPPPPKKDIPVVLLSGVCGLLFYTYASSVSARTLSAATNSILLATSPILTSVFALFFLKERISLLGWGAIAIEFLGIAILTFDNGRFTISTGIIWGLGASAAMCIVNLVNRRLSKSCGSLTATAYCIFSAAIAGAAFCPFSFLQPALTDPAVLLGVLYLGIFSSGVAYLTWFHSLSMAKRTSDTANWGFLSPPLTALLSMFFINEITGINTIIGGSVVLFGLIFFNHKERQ